MAGGWLRLNIFDKLKIRSSIEVYWLKSDTNAKLVEHSKQSFSKQLKANLIMTTFFKNNFYFFLLIAFFKVNAQAGPPPMAKPDINNQLIIDEIIGVTNHESYFINYCTKKVTEYAEENNWSKEKTSEILGSINFKNYNQTIYNSYSFFTEKQLTDLLNVLKSLESKDSFILTNQMMQNNLDLYVRNLIKGKYISGKK